MSANTFLQAAFFSTVWAKSAKEVKKKNVGLPIAKVRAYGCLYADMDTTAEGQNKVLRMAIERKTNSKDIYQSNLIKERVLVEHLKIMAENYQKLMNEDNPREGRNEQQAEVWDDITEITLCRDWNASAETWRMGKLLDQTIYR